MLGWWKHKDDPNILFLKYEEMRKVLFKDIGLSTCFHHFPAHILIRINTTPFFSGDIATKMISNKCLNIGGQVVVVISTLIIGYHTSNML